MFITSRNIFLLIKYGWKYQQASLFSQHNKLFFEGKGHMIHKPPPPHNRQKGPPVCRRGETHFCIQCAASADGTFGIVRPKFTWGKTAASRTPCQPTWDARRQSLTSLHRVKKKKKKNIEQLFEILRRQLQQAFLTGSSIGNFIRVAFYIRFKYTCWASVAWMGQSIARK